MEVMVRLHYDPLIKWRGSASRSWRGYTLILSISSHKVEKGCMEVMVRLHYDPISSHLHLLENFLYYNILYSNYKHADFTI